MTATDELRALLDARGVEWDYAFSGSDTTTFRASGIDLTFTPMRDGLVCSTILTPGQAVEATLGRGECRMAHSREHVECKVDLFECSECDWSGAIDDMTAQVEFPRYCPNCGREVVG